VCVRVRVCVYVFVSVCVCGSPLMLHLCSALLRELTAGIKARGVDSRWCLEKADLVQLYDRLQQVCAMPNIGTTVDIQTNCI